MLPLLENIRVLDFSQFWSGATSKLADLGADVIKVESPDHGDAARQFPPVVPDLEMGLLYVILNRNKRSIAVDLTRESGRAIVDDLVRTSDVVVDAARPGNLDRFGLGYERLKQLRPDIIQCSVSAFGQTGSYRDLPSHGLSIDCAAGLIKVTRESDGTPRISRRSYLGTELGSVYAALSITAALIHRQRTGQGQHLDVALWESAVAANYSFAASLNDDHQTLPDLMDEGGIGPRYDVYATKDDRVILLSIFKRRPWERFCSAVERHDLVARGRWAHGADYGEDDPELSNELQTIMRSRLASDWMDVFRANGVPAAPLVEASELAGDPHVQERHMVVGTTDPRYPKLRFVRLPVRSSEFPCGDENPPPTLGEHTTDILTELGYDDVRHRELIHSGAIGIGES